jgi:hypothetical protein
VRNEYKLSRFAIEMSLQLMHTSKFLYDVTSVMSSDTADIIAAYAVIGVCIYLNVFVNHFVRYYTTYIGCELSPSNRVERSVC